MKRLIEDPRLPTSIIRRGTFEPSSGARGSPSIVGGPGNGGPVEKDSRMAEFRPAQKSGVCRAPGAVFALTSAFARPAGLSPNTGHGHHWFGNAESYFLIGDASGQAVVTALEK